MSIKLSDEVKKHLRDTFQSQMKYDSLKFTFERNSLVVNFMFDGKVIATQITLDYGVREVDTLTLTGLKGEIDMDFVFP